MVKIRSSVDRNYVASNDFVLYIRDENISAISAISALSFNGDYAFGLRVLPDFRINRIKDDVDEKLENM